MTDTETKLHPFEDSDVVAAKIEIPDAAGGLRDALAVAPVELHLGDEGHVVLHYRVKKIRFDPTSGKRAVEGELVRVHVFETLEAAFIDSDEVAEHVRDNALRVKLEIEKIAGKLNLLDEEKDDDDLDVERQRELLRAHDEGLHTVDVVDCEACEDRAEDRDDERADLA